MRAIIYLLLPGALAACRKPCSSIEKVNVRLAPSTLSWKADSVEKFNMISSTGFEVTFTKKYKPEIYRNTHTQNGCDAGELEYLTEDFESTYKDEFGLWLASSTEGQLLSASFNNVSTTYNLSLKKLVPSSTQQGTYNNVVYAFRDQEKIGDRFYDVCDVEIKNTEALKSTDPQRLIFAKGYGLLKYYEKGGTTWERKF